mmetsp:Transcript_9222/g.19427  ORF Transcript_9222/g.19427 Transcript_9222/m.19427 type:complete len:96 (-) Transcript_9222:1998-2285(-)
MPMMEFMPSSKRVEGNNGIGNEGDKQETALDRVVGDSFMISSDDVVGGGQLAVVGVSPGKGNEEKPGGDPIQKHLGMMLLLCRIAQDVPRFRSYN